MCHFVCESIVEFLQQLQRTRFVRCFHYTRLWEWLYDYLRTPTIIATQNGWWVVFGLGLCRYAGQDVYHTTTVLESTGWNELKNSEFKLKSSSWFYLCPCCSINDSLYLKLLNHWLPACPIPPILFKKWKSNKEPRWWFLQELLQRHTKMQHNVNLMLNEHFVVNWNTCSFSSNKMFLSFGQVSIFRKAK